VEGLWSRLRADAGEPAPAVGEGRGYRNDAGPPAHAPAMTLGDAMTRGGTVNGHRSARTACDPPDRENDPMPELIAGHTYVVKADGMPRFCSDYFVPHRPGDSRVQLSHVRCVRGWEDEEEDPPSALDRFVLVLRGLLRVEHEGDVLEARAGEGILIRAGERARTSVTGSSGAEAIVIRLLVRPPAACRPPVGRAPGDGP
jgi:hypothetical protein